MYFDNNQTRIWRSSSLQFFLSLLFFIILYKGQQTCSAWIPWGPAPSHRFYAPSSDLSYKLPEIHIEEWSLDPRASWWTAWLGHDYARGLGKSWWLCGDRLYWGTKIPQMGWNPKIKVISLLLWSFGITSCFLWLYYNPNRRSQRLQRTACWQSSAPRLT